MQSLVIGGVIGGIAGIMLVIDRQFVEPKNFESSITFLAYAALILGGVGAHPRARSSARSLFWFIIEGSQSFLRAGDRPRLPRHRQRDRRRSEVGPVRFVLVGLLIMLLVIFRPQGILGSREEVMIGD